MTVSFFAEKSGRFTDSPPIALLSCSALLLIVEVFDSPSVFILSEDTIEDCW